MNLQLQSRSVFISGSTKGIGRAVAEAFLREGAKVLINGRKDTAATASRLSCLGEVIPIDGDLSDPAQAAEVCAAIDANGPLDILVNNMGIFEPRKFEEIGDAEWLRFFETNVMSTVRLCRHFFPPMLKRDFGRIINIASEAGIRGLESMIHYSMTKGAQVVIGRGLANLTRGCGENVTVNSVLPGPTRTEGVEMWLADSARAAGKSEEEFARDFFRETEPDSLIQRFIRPEEIAHVVTFLASPLSSAINGANIRAEGGIIKSIV